MFSRKKFNALVHYTCWKCQDPTKLGAVKLNKVLWYTDTSAFVQTGKAVTGAKYVKRQFGPVPAAIVPVLNELANEGKLAIRETDFFGRPKREFFAIIPPDISAFTADEVSLADEVIDIICNGHTAGSISEATHNRIWKLAELGEEIPYSAVLAVDLGEVTEDDVRWVRGKMRSAA
jgi:hypothetical protein